VIACVENFFSATDCTGDISFSENTKFGCADAGESNSYLYGFSNATTNIQSLLPSTGKTFAVAAYYSDTGCAQEVLAIDGVVNHQCVSDTAFSSLLVDYPMEMKYNVSTTCLGSYVETIYPERCSPSLKNDTSFLYVNSMLINATLITEDDDVKLDHKFDFTNGAIVGIVIGAVAFAGLLIGLRYFMVYYRNRRTESLLRNHLISNDSTM
jgi:NADH:ubiquinone oxidoreductase subunit K